MEKIIADFFEDMERIGRSQCTIAGYKNDISLFEKFCGERLTIQTFRPLVREFLALCESIPENFEKVRSR